MANITLDKLKTIVQSIVASVTRYKPNLAVNDPDDPRYVAGRLCYKTVKAVDDVKETTVTFAENEGMYASTEMLPIPSVQAAGDVRTVVWDGTKYVCKAADYADGMGYTLGNLSILAAAMGETAPDTGEPFVWMVIPQYGVSTLGTADTAETHTVRCYGEKEVIHELPQEYLPQIPAEKLPEIPVEKIPDLGLANVAYSGSYNDLWNKPTIPANVVQYTAQSLTTSQKTQARTNIGAGTSSFDGAYSSLTGAPTLATVATSGSYQDLAEVPCKATVEKTIRASGTTTMVVVVAQSANGKMVNRFYTSPVFDESIKYDSALVDKTYRLATVYDGDKVNYTPVEGKFSFVYSDQKNYSYYYFGNPEFPHLYKDVIPAGEDDGTNLGLLIVRYPYEGSRFESEGWTVAAFFIRALDGGAATNHYACELSEIVENVEKLADKFLNDTIQRVGEPVYLTDSAGAKWQLVVGTDGTLSTTAATE